MKIVQIVGARPQFIKYFPVARAVEKMSSKASTIKNVLVHTGQHYVYGMSKIFFEQLDIPETDINLGIGSGSHGDQTSRMLAGIEKVLIKEQPDWAIVYGDTNSTLAGALAASKLHMPVAHVEAGLRSFNREMPEEINRVLTDHVSQLLFCPTDRAVKNLASEGITQGVYHVGDVMYDALLYYSSVAENRSEILSRIELKPSGYILMTLHRPVNTDTRDSLEKIILALAQLKEYTFVFPIHPRTQKAIREGGVSLPKNLFMTDPVGYVDMLALEKNAIMILTDSGGVQKEAYLLKIPCITLREETEWIETVEAGWNILVGSDTERIVQAVKTFKPVSDWPPLFGDGHAAEQIVRILTESEC